jgi:hypothetical protein
MNDRKGTKPVLGYNYAVLLKKQYLIAFGRSGL